MTELDVNALFRSILNSASQRFGPMTPGWAIAPIQFWEAHPESIFEPTSRTVNVFLSMTTQHYRPQALYQLAHEAIHCLIASGRRDTVFFEEGLAVEHSLTFSGIPRAYRRSAAKTLPRDFNPPHKAFKALHATDDQIRALRQDLPTLEGITPEEIRRLFHVTDAIAEAVCERMPMQRGLI